MTLNPRFGIGVSKSESARVSCSEVSLPVIMPLEKDTVIAGVRLVTNIVFVMLTETYISFLAMMRMV